MMTHTTDVPLILKSPLKINCTITLKVKTDKGQETPARTQLGATTVLAVVTIGFGGKAKPQVMWRSLKYVASMGEDRIFYHFCLKTQKFLK